MVSKRTWKILFAFGITFNMIASLLASMRDSYTEAIWYLLLVGIILYAWDSN